MKHLLNKNVKNIEISGIRKISNLIDKSSDTVNMTFGQPNFSTPDYIKDAAIRAIKDNHTDYTETAGVYELRQAACDYVEKLYGLNYNPENEIIVTVGASEALDITLRTILNEDSEVIMPAPVFVGYEPLIKMCNAKVVYVDTTETDFKMTASMIEEKLTDKTRCVLLPYPSNPTGTVLTKEEVMEIGELLRGKDIFIISDEIYSELVYESKHFSIGAVPGLKDQTIIINGLSKSHAMTGWRIGFAFAPAYLVDQFYAVHSFNAICAPSISQYASIEALRQGVDREEIMMMKEDYKRRRDFVYSRIKEMGLKVTKPEGAFYIFPSIKNTGLTSEEFASRLLEEANVAVIPGSAFSSYGEGYLRISYAQSMEELVKGMEGLERFLTKLAQEA
ncbi:aromatic amino acid aminotransferase [Sporosarcina sp. P18a]|uniref:aminotransferase A n=1 Tax=Sporosarcina sp. P18a TaxID=2048259 RepID=UPI000C172689|nr:aminotransferase A [Sporosarcina sp. P18a]PIC80009.1 aromatic amino acid aminotransferase [Sporosarcina sp. P18a]